jgi:hypothetical protein
MKRHLGSIWLGMTFCGVVFAHAEGFEFAVKHDHALKSCKGQLLFKDETVEYSTSDKKHARVWSYRNIQQIGLLGPKKISILTYEDQKMKFGKDRTFEFEITEGAADAQLAAFLDKRVGRPLVSVFAPEIETPRYQIYVKHRRGLGGGTQGRLELSDQYIAYVTEALSDSRVWSYRDISSVGTTGPFQLRLTSMERVDGEYGDGRNFVFDLKERLDPKAYDFLWWKVNGPQIQPNQSPQNSSQTQ